MPLAVLVKTFGSDSLFLYFASKTIDLQLKCVDVNSLYLAHYFTFFNSIIPLFIKGPFSLFQSLFSGPFTLIFLLICLFSQSRPSDLPDEHNYIF